MTLPTRPSKRLPMIAAAIACLALVLAVLAGAGDAIVWPLAGLALAAIGALIYLARAHQSGR